MPMYCQAQIHVAGIMVSNLERPRPEVWRDGTLFQFIEDAWNNAIATVGNKNVIAARLTAIDAIFEDIQNCLKPATINQIVPTFLLLRAFGSYRSAAMLSLSLPTDSFPLQRSCLESAGYAQLIAVTPELSKLWLMRNEDEKSRKRFTNAAVRDAIEAADPQLAKIYQELYERTIDFGAHPNEKAITGNLMKESLGTENIRYLMLPGDSIMLDHGMRTCAQVGICALKVLSLIFVDQFAALNIKERVDKIALPF
jgi:hypothetical protein